jgi:hypothetical protein
MQITVVDRINRGERRAREFGLCGESIDNRAEHFSLINEAIVKRRRAQVAVG